jgi:hypothetical protein
MALGMMALLTGLWTGLQRLGWGLPSLRPGLALYHGPLMLSGFLGTLIALERAVALKRGWGYFAPLMTGLGALALVFGIGAPVGSWLMTMGSGIVLVIFTGIIYRQPALYTVTMGLGALAWLAGNSLWSAGWPLYMVVPWWVGFLVLTVAGERLELSRLLQLSTTSKAIFLVGISLFMSGAIVSPTSLSLAWRLNGAGLVMLALWLLYYDLARRTVRMAGLTRFIALCLLSGYVWLAVGGILGVWFSGQVAGPYYDAILHTVFLGFGFAMIFGHAPIIFPAVLGVAVPFRPTFYAHLSLLHLSLVVRVVGDLTLWWPGRRWGGLLNMVALGLFLASTGRAMLKAPNKLDATVS